MSTGGSGGTRRRGATADASPRRVTGEDVAREAGVSRATVSYVLNAVPHQTIPAATRDRVRMVAARLRYAPSGAARTLSRGRSDIVLGLLQAELPPHEQFSALVECFAEVLSGAGLTLVTHPWSRNRAPARDIAAAISPVAVIALHLEDDEVAAMRDLGVVVIEQMFSPTDFLGAMSASVQSQIAVVQVDALIRAGHRTIAYAAPGDERRSDESGRRLERIRTVCEGYGLPRPEAALVDVDVAAAAAQVLDWRDVGVTAICAFDDTTALAVLAGLRALGLSAPRDLAVVGLYDTPAARLAEPPLTSVAIDSQAMAECGVAGLLDRLRGRAVPPQRLPPVAHLVERASV